MEIGTFLLSLTLIIVAAKLFGELAERLGQPPVLGELIAGIILGPSLLGWVRESDLLHLLAELGAIILLFEVGIHSKLSELMRLGIWSFIVACVGVILPFVGGYFTCAALGMTPMVAIFVGATLTATSVGITARVFRDLKILEKDESKIVLGAAVADDVIGLIILAVVVKLVAGGSIDTLNIFSITLLAVGFLVGGMLIGNLVAKPLIKFINKMRVAGSLIAAALSFCLVFAYLANAVGLAPIVGAFTAGLILSQTERKTHIAEQLTPLYDIFVPIFFVLMGTIVDIGKLNPFDPNNSHLLIVAGILIAVAVIGKVAAGYSVIKGKLDRLLIGIGMIPRGEVGLIFASLGLTRGIIDTGIYSVIVTLVIFTTLITPSLLVWKIRRG